MKYNRRPLPVPVSLYASRDEATSEASWPRLDRLKQLSHASAKHHGIQEFEMRKDRRQAIVVRARYIAIKAAFDSGYRICELARYYNRDHTSILYALRTIKASVRAMRMVHELVGMKMPADLSLSLGEVFNGTY